MELEEEGQYELVPFIGYEGVDQVILWYGVEHVTHNVDNAVVSLQVGSLHLLTVDCDESLQRRSLLNYSQKPGGAYIVVVGLQVEVD